MAKQFAISTRSFDKFQEKEAFSGILPKGISQNIILRVFKTPGTFFFSILLQIRGKLCLQSPLSRCVLKSIEYFFC